MAINEINEAQKWLYSMLTANATVVSTFGTNVGANPLPRDKGFPRLTYNCFTPQDDLLLVGTGIFWAGLRFVVRAIVEGNDTLDVDAGLEAMHDSIHGQYGFTTDAYIVSCVRVRPYYLHEMSDSIEYTHIGGEYLIRIRPRN